MSEEDTFRNQITVAHQAGQTIDHNMQVTDFVQVKALDFEGNVSEMIAHDKVTVRVRLL